MSQDLSSETDKPQSFEDQVFARFEQLTVDLTAWRGELKQSTDGSND
jgi:hypothetical protein